MDTMNILLSAVIQLLLFTIIPFVWWLIKARRQERFFSWLGLRHIVIKDKRAFVVSFFMSFILLLVPGLIFILTLADRSNIAATQFAGKGISAVLQVLIHAFIQTGLSEEILFRGFLAKRLIKHLRFTAGNTIQALLFGLLHGLMLFSYAGLLSAVAVTLITATAGWMMGYINEKQSGGSIISSWLLHALGNMTVAILMMFNVI